MNIVVEIMKKKILFFFFYGHQFLSLRQFWRTLNCCSWDKYRLYMCVITVCFCKFVNIKLSEFMFHCNYFSDDNSIQRMYDFFLYIIFLTKPETFCNLSLAQFFNFHITMSTHCCLSFLCFYRIKSILR